MIRIQPRDRVTRMLVTTLAFDRDLAEAMLPRFAWLGHPMDAVRLPDDGDAVRLHLTGAEEGTSVTLRVEPTRNDKGTSILLSDKHQPLRIVAPGTGRPGNDDDRVQIEHALSVLACLRDALDHLVRGAGVHHAALVSAAAVAAEQARTAEGLSDGFGCSLLLRTPLSAWSIIPPIRTKDRDRPPTGDHHPLIAHRMPAVVLNHDEQDDVPRFVIDPVSGEHDPRDSAIVRLRRHQIAETLMGIVHDMGLVP